ncbi:GNAT family N-acetyltransferase [Brachybacterium sp. EF45031]|uniref:GNAT family N-acetyltransferase n=1 Tax=Brachybacterium sillae TaxID=2810536 RepID=UPI00217EB1DE|nr:GNAT family protein [Brachybacterium sillae]MCS6712622.1 GNAT family N-acetyltransferase [Brachybacterium sillae]
MPDLWPFTLRHGDLELRPLQRRDRRAYERLREHNRDWLEPWDVTDPHLGRLRPPFATLLRWSRDQARRGAGYSLVIVVDGRLAGQVSASPVLHGSISSASVGYWVDRGVAGRGIAPRAVALLIEHLLGAMGLHRVEVCIRPENTASLRVAQKLGLRDEGTRERYLHVDGAWRDHRCFAVTAEELTPGVQGVHPLVRLLQSDADADGPARRPHDVS